jgi:hypothetical protein
MVIDQYLCTVVALQGIDGSDTNLIDFERFLKDRPLLGLPEL